MIQPVGPFNAKIMVVGESPTWDEASKNRPFIGYSGDLLNDMLHEAGLMRSECFLTYFFRESFGFGQADFYIPQTKKGVTADHSSFVNGHNVLPEVEKYANMLGREVDAVKPDVVIPLGNGPLWYFTGKWGIKSWRGSMLTYKGKACIPTYTPDYVLKDWEVRSAVVNDLRRVKRAALNGGKIIRPDYKFILRPQFAQVFDYCDRLIKQLDWRPIEISCDIETRNAHIACIGLATDLSSAICIPLMCVERKEGYWNESEELAVVSLLQRVLCHPNARVVGQNFIYDTQYFVRHFGWTPRFDNDTMLRQNVCYPGTPKGLDYISSLYCDYYVYWKDDSKDWDPKVGEDQLWGYNCQDTVYTLECARTLDTVVEKLDLREPDKFQQAMFWPVLQAMVRGVRVDLGRREALSLELANESAERLSWLQGILGHPFNPKSPLQMKRLFYEDLAQKEIFDRKTRKVTCNEKALQTIAAKEPILRPLVRVINEFRSLGVFRSTFIEATLDLDQRLRCSFNIAGTETWRLSSSEDAFGSGLNLQNIPKGDEEGDIDQLRLPNVRKIFIPDEEYIFFEGDLAKADAQVVAWEADDHDLKQLFREGYDLHRENAKALGVDYALAKRWVHATNYYARPRTMATSCGISVHRAEQMHTRWFAIHPGIADWQRRTEAELRSKRVVQNIWGYKRHYFDRLEGLLPEALAWKAQSTVAIYINHIWMDLFLNHPEIQVLLQVHDSLAGQFLNDGSDHIETLACVAGRNVIPYEDPLVIPFSISTSALSWGDCK